MGQRLVISVKSGGDRVAALYYHWSAYSLSALHEARDILNYLLDDDNAGMDVRLACIRFAEQNGGGISASNGGDADKELKYIQSIFPNETFKTDGISRNYGLVGISKEEMDDIEDWSEGDIIIDLDNDTVTDEVFIFHNNLDDINAELADCYEDENDYTPYTEDDVIVPDRDLDVTNFNFSDIDDVICAVEEAYDSNGVIACDGGYVTLIA